MEPAARESKTNAIHLPVLLREVLQQLRLEPGLTIVDGTVGAGGHSREMLKSIGQQGRLIGLDRDPMMLGHASQTLSGLPVTLHQGSYIEMPAILSELGIAGVDRVLLDLGLSSDQLADVSRGFGFESDGPLDLRFDTTKGHSAAQVLASASASELEQIFHDFGEEPLARPLAQFLVQRRSTMPITTGRDLARAVIACPAFQKYGHSERHPATRIFQALRIAVNHELEHVQRGIEISCHQALKPGGLLAVITFHSLEDRLVKNEFRNKQRWQVVTSKPIIATPQEQRFNPRSRSATLRVAIKRSLPEEGTSL